MAENQSCWYCKKAFDQLNVNSGLCGTCQEKSLDEHKNFREKIKSFVNSNFSQKVGEKTSITKNAVNDIKKLLDDLKTFQIKNTEYQRNLSDCFTNYGFYSACIEFGVVC